MQSQKTYDNGHKGNVPNAELQKPHWEVIFASTI